MKSNQSATSQDNSEEVRKKTLDAIKAMAVVSALLQTSAFIIYVYGVQATQDSLEGIPRYFAFTAVAGIIESAAIVSSFWARWLMEIASQRPRSFKRFLGFVPFIGSLALLIAMTDDASWWVRFQAFVKSRSSNGKS